MNGPCANRKRAIFLCYDGAIRNLRSMPPPATKPSERRTADFSITRNPLYDFQSPTSSDIPRKSCRSCIVRKTNLDAEPPEVTDPRATDGDSRFEPDWSERLTLRVGQDRGDLIGRDDKVLQAAVDYVARLGGGTVQVLPGTYVLRNAVSIPSHVRLLGSGPDSILTKIGSVNTPLAEDSDWYDQEITLVDRESFQVGDGVVLRAKNPHHGGATVIKRTLVARNGSRFKLNQGLRENLWLSGQPTCASLFPLITSERNADFVIENITLDGNKEHNENFNGNYGGCIFLQDCSRVTIRKVIAHNYNGDGISFQICHDVEVMDCHSHDNTDLGVHPGSGSQRPRLIRNRMERNSQGIFWCWGVKYGLAEENILDGNRLYGSSIGHNDTDNHMRKNIFRNNGKHGVLFRDEPQGKDFWANRNTLENNQFENNGGDGDAVIEVAGQTHDIQIIGNRFTETRKDAKRVGIHLGKRVGKTKLDNNHFVGLTPNIIDDRT